MKRKWIAGVGMPIPILAMASVLAWPAPVSAEARVKLIPDLHPGEIICYEIRGRVQRHTKEESRVGTITTPGDVQQELSAVLRVKIKTARHESGGPVIEAEAAFEYPLNRAAVNPAVEERKLRFTIGGNGQLLRAEGMDDLNPVERIAWEFWVSRFAFGWTLHADRLKRGETWKSEEPETTPSPIGHLVWEKETTYGEDANCPLLTMDLCAVFYTHASLKQKSSNKDSTPEDYRLHELKTSGSAAGTNETYTVISQKTGLSMRGTEEVKQSMNVVIAKADASNAVKYTVEASSHFEMVMVTPDLAPR